MVLNDMIMMIYSATLLHGPFQDMRMLKVTNMERGTETQYLNKTQLQFPKKK